MSIKKIRINKMRELVFILLLSIMTTSSGQRSLVDLRDSTNVKRHVIIISCECSCDTIPKIDSLPI